ncbi:Asparaginase [Fusarium sp. Ph1]|nr:Asparaginase [Fusarium sp. Ph1]
MPLISRCWTTRSYSQRTVVSLQPVSEVIPSAIRKRLLDDLLITALLYQHIPSAWPIRPKAPSLVPTSRAGLIWAMAKKRLPEDINAESQRDDTASLRNKDNPRNIMQPVLPFNNLPPEIQSMIWDLSMEGYIHVPHEWLQKRRAYPDCELGMPSCSQVCKEARNIARRRRERVRIWQDGDQKPIQALVDPERDALYYDSNWNIGGGFEEIEHVFETIIINPRRGVLSVILLREWTTTFDLSPRLKKIQVVCLAYDWEIPRSSVGTANNFLIFDLDEKTDIERLLELRSLHPDSKISYHVDPCSETSDTSASEASDTSASEMSDHSVSEMFDHSDTKISWELVDEDIRCLQTSSLPLHIVDGTSECLEISEECSYLWLKDCRGSGGSDQYVYLPEGATVELKENDFYTEHVIELSWLALNAILSQIWSKDLDNEPTFQRVIQFYIGQ